MSISIESPAASNAKTDPNHGIGISGANVNGLFSISHPKQATSMTRTSSQKKIHMSLTRLPSASRSELNVSRKSLPKLTRAEILTIAAICCGNFCLGTLYALLAPFFPHEAEKRGVTPTQYGCIFGIFEFGQFLFAPVAGFLIPVLGMKVAITSGLFLTGFCTILFACLEWSPPGWTYFWFAFILRFVSAAGAASYFTAVYTLIATEFQDRLSTLFGLAEMMFGVGMIIGPSIGGVLFEYGGFSCPFFVVGVTVYAATIFSFFCLPKRQQVTKDDKSRVSPLSLITKLGVSINLLITFTSFINVGFNDATLEHHLRDFTSMTPTSVGGMFLVSGLLYALTTQLWGLVIDKYGYAHFFVICGYVFAALCFMLCGPMYPIPMRPNLALVIVAQAMYGVSTGPMLVGSFTEGLAETVRSGYPDDVPTSASMSAIYQSACSLGAAVGPVVGGILMDNWGYGKASSVLFMLQITMIVVLVVFNGWRHFSSKGDVRHGNLS